jgi:hypothetical protein
MGTKNLEIVNGRSLKKVPDNVRLTGVLLDGVRQQYKLDAERHLLTRQPISATVAVQFEKTTYRQPVDVAAYWPIKPTEPIKS